MRHLRTLASALLVATAATACGVSDEGSPPTTATTADPAPAASALPLRYGTVTERDLDGGADGRNTTAALTSMDEFSLDLYRAVVAEQGGNTIISPYSVTFALGMVYAGADGATADEMATVLHADSLAPEDWHEGINAYDLTLDARTTGSPTEWSAANKVWAAPGLPLLDPYLDVLTSAYGSPVAEADFAAAADAERRVINGWVDERTGGLVDELFAPGTIRTNTRLALVNAVALDAPWEFPFDPAATRTGDFIRSDGSTVAVPMMHYDEFLPSAWTEDVVAVELPYGGGALSMVILVPNDLDRFEAEMTPTSIDSILGQIENGGIHLSMPKWTARTDVRLEETLAGMGMPTAFGSDADFSGMVDGGGLWLDVVVHEAVIEVDEEGTRAAAATGAAMAESHGPTIDVDRPFLYLIRDTGAGVTLFMGRVVDPTIDG